MSWIGSILKSFYCLLSALLRNTEPLLLDEDCFHISTYPFPHQSKIWIECLHGLTWFTSPGRSVVSMNTSTHVHGWKKNNLSLVKALNWTWEVRTEYMHIIMGIFSQLACGQLITSDTTIINALYSWDKLTIVSPSPCTDNQCNICLQIRLSIWLPLDWRK